jgi:asparagine synthetase B (glutamine-hydrolysing)
VNYQIHTRFDLDQHKDTFDDWTCAFEEAVRLRANTRYPITIPLSGGYDSGCIAAAMLSLGARATYYSFQAEEDLAILDSRHQIINGSNNGSARLLRMTRDNKQQQVAWLTEHSPDFNYSLYLKNARYSMSSDPGAIGLSSICEHAQNMGSRVLLSGQGADEITSDYGYKGIKYSQDSHLAGMFPDDLRSVFPWPNFFDGVNRCYLLKEEYVTGSHGVEGRYPFLDFDVVQEFLSISSSLKNSAYKAPLAAYLKSRDFPVSYNQKRGFNATHGI